MDKSKKQGSQTPKTGLAQPVCDRLTECNPKAANRMHQNEAPKFDRGTEIAKDTGNDHKQRPQRTQVNPKEGKMFSTKKRNEKGFTLIELMIVVVIIGILAALAIPRFMRATTKSKQSEAKQVLKQIYTMQHAYRQEYDAYALNGITASAAAPTGFGRIGVDIMTTARYTYSMVAAAATFTATATSGVLDDDAVADTWTIDENGDLVVTSDDAVL